MASTTSTDGSAPTGTSTPPSTSGQLNGTNYFFGFLVAFIAFLFVFLSLGLLARRRRMRLMRDFMLYGPDDSGLPNVTQREPTMWQPLYREAKGQLWSNIMPLSTSLVQREVTDDKTPAEELPSRHSRNPLVYLGMKPQLKGPPKTLVTEAMNIAVVINMPQAPAASEEDDRHEYHIGTLQIPWKDDVLSQT
ncbi:hypothetical protein DFH06DRAFT_1315154 [Mycena polygramma]|nr:hypothetical protein DFH06DRAFT_1315154 [Mycena polygramma]